MRLGNAVDQGPNVTRCLVSQGSYAMLDFADISAPNEVDFSNTDRDVK